MMKHDRDDQPCPICAAVLAALDDLDAALGDHVVNAATAWSVSALMAMDGDPSSVMRAVSRALIPLGVGLVVAPTESFELPPGMEARLDAKATARLRDPLVVATAELTDKIRAITGRVEPGQAASALAYEMCAAAARGTTDPAVAKQILRQLMVSVFAQIEALGCGEHP